MINHKRAAEYLQSSPWLVVAKDSVAFFARIGAGVEGGGDEAMS